MAAATVAALTLALVSAGCRTPTAIPTASLLEPLARPVPHPPDESDAAAAHLAEAALAGDTPAMERALDQLYAAEAERSRLEREEAEARNRRRGPRVRPKVLGLHNPPEGRPIVPHALNLVNSSLENPIAYRRASARLLLRADLDAGLRERLQRAVNDDPLRLARKRTWDTRQIYFAHVFNSVSAPLGRSLVTGVAMAPYQLSMAVVHFAAGLWERTGMTVQERQALVHRKRFLAAHPHAPEVPDIARKVEKSEAKLRKLRRKRTLERAHVALDAHQPELASVLAEHALLSSPGNEEAKRVLEEADAQIARRDELRARSLAAAEDGPRDLALAPEETRALVESLLVDSRELVRETRALRRAAPGPELRDESDFVLALAQYESGYESRSWENIADLAERSPRRSNMARYAAALDESSWQNPYGSYVERKRRGRSRSALVEIFGRWANGPRYRKLPRPLAYLLDLPAVAQTVITTPVRFLLTGLRDRPDFQGPAAVAGYRYLALHPDGQHSRELIEWLFEYEKSQKNWPAALRLADFQPGFDPESRRELVEETAKLGLQAADRIDRPDLRNTVLRDVVRQYPDSDAGYMAGILAREEVKLASPQRIRMTRQFLRENPQIAGTGGLGLRPALLDGELYNGELHPTGVTFLGGRVVEFNLVDESGDEENAPVKVRHEVSSERLARCAAMLEETTLRNARIDPDDELAPDPERDLYFERARLGLTEDLDRRPSAQSTYVFEGMRERYGMVRGRDSILPFDLVVTGSFLDLSIGAYPRWRQPRETPDAFLYR